MQDDIVIKVEHVSKDFILPHEKVTSVKGLFTSIYKRRTKAKEIQHALKDVSFEIRKGEFFGIVGRNGSGKSTMLKMLAGIYQPTKGKVETRGKLVPFIELGVGFNPELTGRENVYLNGAMMGFSEKEVDDMYDDIVVFAELEEFMDQKLKNYSSGMQVRLAFSVAIKAEADVLLIDEVLAVGDADFQRKCFDYFRHLKKSKTTVVFVSHDMNAVIEYCDRAVLIEQSRIVMAGNPEMVAREYGQLFVESTEEDTESNAKEGEDSKKRKRWGDQKAVVQTCRVDKVGYQADKDREIVITTKVVGKQMVDHNISIGFLVKSSAGVSILGTNTYVQHEIIKGIREGEVVTVSWRIPNVFGDGKYLVDAAVTSTDGSTNHDWRESICKFRVYRDMRTPYVVTPDMPVKVERLR